MALEHPLKEKRQAILRIASQHGARNVRVFGSWLAAKRMRKATLIFWLKWNPDAVCSTWGGLNTSWNVSWAVVWTW